MTPQKLFDKHANRGMWKNKFCQVQEGVVLLLHDFNDLNTLEALDELR